MNSMPTPSPTALETALGLAITHHGAVRGVTGSCHRLTLIDPASPSGPGRSVLVDCGLFQGAETSGEGGAGGAGPRKLDIDFSLDGVQALVVTHVHIDHVGRIPYLLAAGFSGPILCTPASAQLLPMVLEDALEIGFTRDRRLIERVLGQLARQIVAVPYKTWWPLMPPAGGAPGLRLRYQHAGHILGSAYAELELVPAGGARRGRAGATAGAADGAGPPPRVVFSGDLGAPYTPLLPAPQAPERADIVVIESTYGDRVHESRKTRRERLQALVEHAFGNGGTVLIPAFSIGRTQELLFELEEIIHRHRDRVVARNGSAAVPWKDLVVVVDSPLAADFTRGYSQLKAHWDDEARTKLAAGRHPLDFSQRQTVRTHEQHLQVVRHLASTHQPAIVIAASGMCAGGRIVNYLKAMLPDPRHDVLFSGFQAAGTPGREILRQAGRIKAKAEWGEVDAPGTPGGGPGRPGAGGGDDGGDGPSVMLDGERIPIRAGVHVIGGFSAHADQADLLNFVGRMKRPPRQVRVVHGDDGAKATLAGKLRERVAGVEVVVPRG
jgi:metallo-beta-lactamase family protein